MIKLKAIAYEHELLYERACTYARELDLVLDLQMLPRLCLSLSKLSLILENFSPLFVDLSPYGQKSRLKWKNQALVRACKPRLGMKIVDATPGWGRDAVILSSFGAEVLMVERNAVMAALLADGISRRGGVNTPSLNLLAMDAKDYLRNLSASDCPDLIYLDPMHPMRRNSALVKKDMQALQQLIGVDYDAYELLALAITRAARVVLKWPQHLAPLLPPDRSIGTDTVRFDIYLNKTQ